MEDKPLISLIVRTMNRPELPEAIQCIARQTYDNIEVIVVDAKGDNQLNLTGFAGGRFPVRIISKNRHLLIPEAANAGLDAVRGEYFGFLDEDDLIDKNHVQNLFDLLHNCDAVAAYSDIKMIDQNGRFIRFYNEEYSYERILTGNFIPVHALLIRSEVLNNGCRSDERLKILDDWDFLLQVSQHGKFLHLKKTTGVYRNFGSSGVQQNEEAIRFYKKMVYSKWKDKLTDEEYINFIDYLTNIYGKQVYESNLKVNTANKISVRKDHQWNLRLDGIIKPISNIINSIEELLPSKLKAPLRFSKRLMKNNYIYTMPNVSLIKQSGLLDEKYYLQNNPDVKASGMNPARHYLLYGGFEGRKPSEKFDSSFYLDKYPDVKESGMNPLVHYIRFGQAEGRKYLRK